MRILTEWIALLAHSDAPVLIVGERGSGKELLARAIHTRGPRREAPFLVLDRSSLAKIRLFGVEGGLEAWVQDGRGGTLVLDGFEQLSFAEQTRLLALVDEPPARAGNDDPRGPRSVRLMTLSRGDAAGTPASAQLHESLRHRLRGMQLHVPPLRDRAEDLRPLVMQLLRELAPRRSPLPIVTPSAWEALSRYPYPGNVRELRWVLEHALARTAGGPIDRAHLPAVVGKR
jgi:two-component system response regulator PilR (NtrC family)